MVAEVGSGSYNVLLVLHLLSVIIGFGTMFLAGIYGVHAQDRKGREGLAISEASYAVNRWAEWAIYLVPVTGILLIMMSGDVWKFSQTWISLSFLVYIALLGVLHGAYLPNTRRMNALLAELTDGSTAGGGAPAQVAEVEQRGKRAAMLGGMVNLLVVVALVVMVWKPGFP